MTWFRYSCYVLENQKNRKEDIALPNFRHFGKPTKCEPGVCRYFTEFIKANENFLIVIVKVFSSHCYQMRYRYTMSWELWKHPDPVPGVRPMFLKPKFQKESKNGFKKINYRPPSVMFFSKNYFRHQKSLKKLESFTSN